MVNVASEKCLNGSCTKRPSFNVNGSKKALYCKEHTENGMANVLGQRCAHESCTRLATFSIEGSKRVEYCK